MGFGELVLIVLIVVVVFGATRLPGLGDGLARLLRGDEPAAPRLLLQRQHSWAQKDWAVLTAILLLAAATIALVVTGI
jgi:hypothetical protein